MNILTRIVSGLLSWLSRKKQTNTSNEPMTTGTQMDSQTEIRVHKIISGPYSAMDDFDEDEDFWFVEALVEYGDGELEEMTICHEDFDKIYAIVKHLNGPTVEPYILAGGE